MRSTSFKKAQKRRQERRRRNKKVAPTGETGWSKSIQTVGGVAGGSAGFIELFLLLCAL
tara:strand:- start:335 stop:511 length:177 start_codon:yes stop_codon:yes gene_type:complete